MANLRSFFSNFIFIFLHLGCFISFSTRHHRNHPKPPSSSPFLRVSLAKLKRHKTISSTLSFIKKKISYKPISEITKIPSPPPSTRSSSMTRRETRSGPNYEIHPCPHCGEVFPKSGLLEQHQSIKHTVYELSDDDPSKNVVRIIFGSGWPGSIPTIYRVMKIHNTPKILTRFEEYRETVKSKVARPGGSQRADPRCLADGNELLRFHCTTFLCDLSQNGNSSICAHKYCSVCGIIGSGFSPKLDGISTSSNSWKGHLAIPDDIEQEFRFMNVKRAMLLCRVIAGRVGYESGLGVKDDPGYDSLVEKEFGVAQTRLDENDELIVFNPRAVLPCFVILYTV